MECIFPSSTPQLNWSQKCLLRACNLFYHKSSSEKLVWLHQIKNNSWLSGLGHWIHTHLPPLQQRASNLKLDFKKVFDKIKHKAMLKIMKCKVFGETWLLWMEKIIGSGTSSVLLNSASGKGFSTKEELGRGSPLTSTLCDCSWSPLVTTR